MKKFKKVIITSLIVLSAVCAGSALSACTADGGHEHKFGEWSDLVNTCTNHVQVRKCTECDLEETKTLEAAGHSYEEWADVVNTCEKHVQSRACKICGAEETQEIKADGHKYGDWVLTVDTCTERVQTRECEVCGHVEVDDKFIAKGHRFGEWTDFVNSCTDHVQIRICQNKDCGWKEYQSLKAAGHTYGEWRDLTDTCLKHIQVHSCTECGAEETQEVPAHGHEFVADRCVYCGTLGYNGESLDYLDRYNGTYGRDYFEDNGLYAEYALYNRIDEQSRIFHVNTQLNAKYQSINGSPCYVVAGIEFADLGLSYQKAVSVWKTYKDDNPLYYWISNGVSIEGDEKLLLLCYSDYASGDARKSANRLIDSEIVNYVSLLNESDNIYGKALAFHDAIIKAIDYAYQSDGTTPSNEAWAHNIMGVFEKRGGTCEAYTRAFQLLLNYAGIENVGVTGTANGGHAWNLVRLDDGNWYWCDLTWDDTPAQQTGISHNYFMVNDTQNVNRQDGGISSVEKTFLDSHTYETPDGTGVNFLYALPERSSEVYSQGGAYSLRRTFNTTNAVYAVTGYKTVQYVNSLTGGAVAIPERVVSSGIAFTVTSVGRISNGLFGTGSVLSESVTSVSLPKTVEYIWDSALYGNNLQNITVDSQNASYSSVEGVLFYYSGEYLVQYPCDRAGTSYTIPDGCTDVAYGAFNGIKNLKSLTIGKDVSDFGLASWGTHYEHSRNFVAGDLTYICIRLDGGKISVHEENERFVAEENALYTVDPVYKLLRIECVFDKSITSFELGANVFRINFSVFNSCDNLAAITVADGNEYLKSIGGIVYDIERKEILVIPNAISGDIVLSDDIDNIGTIGSGEQTAETFNRKGIISVTFGKNVTELGSYAFAYCDKLTTINYGGTYEEWREIKKAETWCYNTGNIRIVCSGGIVCDKNGNVIA